MRYARYLTVMTVALLGLCPLNALAETEPSAYIERWAAGTLTTGEPFESWRIHVVVPDGDDWVTSGINGWVSGGPTWYLEWRVATPPDPARFATEPDSEFASYFTTPHLYPNSDLVDGVSMSADGVWEPTYVHLSSWFDMTCDTDGDYVVWQGTVLNPIPGAYGSIEFHYVTDQELYVHPVTFTIPEPATAALLALGLAAALRRGRRRRPMVVR